MLTFLPIFEFRFPHVRDDYVKVHILKLIIMKKILLIFLLLLAIYQGKAQVLEQDSLALVAFYNSTNGDNWYLNTHWLGFLPVEYWFGVEISNNRVVQLNLPYNNLEGDIPKEIGDIDSLSILDLSSNTIYDIPSSIGNLITLDTLAFFGCPIESLPPEIGNLSDLKYLNISYTQITNLPDEIGGLTRLEYLIGNNGLLQNIPETIGNLTSLIEIDLSLNDITNLPIGIGNCTNLIKLQLNANEIPEVPHEIGNITNLETLILGDNNISELPDELFSLTSLKKLNFAANNLDFIPTSIGNLINLENFQFFENEFMSIPDEIGNLTNLEYINGYSNKLNALPLTLLNLPNVETLFLVYNALTFEDIEPLVSINGFEYWGQDSVGVNIDTTVYLNSSYYMEILTGGVFNQYQWIKDNEIIEGATNYYLELSNLAFADSGEYRCEITNTVTTGLTLQSRLIKLHIKDFSSINELDNQNLLSSIIYPNPANENIFINLLNAVNLHDIEILLYNQYGVLLKNFRTRNINPFKIDISNLNKGVYYIQLIENNKGIKSKIKKLIIV